MDFKERLIKIRHFRGLTQAQLAQRIELTSRSVQNYELGARMPGKTIIEKLADALDVTEKAFFDDDEFSKFVFIFEEDIAQKRARATAERLIRDSEKLFNGDSFNWAEKREVMKKIEEIYWTNRVLTKPKRAGVMYAD